MDQVEGRPRASVRHPHKEKARGKQASKGFLWLLSHSPRLRPREHLQTGSHPRGDEIDRSPPALGDPVAGRGLFNSVRSIAWCVKRSESIDSDVYSAGASGGAVLSFMLRDSLIETRSQTSSATARPSPSSAFIRSFASAPRIAAHRRRASEVMGSWGRWTLGWSFGGVSQFQGLDSINSILLNRWDLDLITDLMQRLSQPRYGVTCSYRMRIHTPSNSTDPPANPNNTHTHTSRKGRSARHRKQLNAPASQLAPTNEQRVRAFVCV
jgi:hypothetical protein